MQLVVHLNDFNSMDVHEVIRLTIETGGGGYLRFAFDPTGAQFGWQEYLVPWDEYVQHRVYQIVHEVPIPKVCPQHAVVDTLCKECDNNGDNEIAVRNAYVSVMAVINTALSECEKTLKMSLDQIRKQTPQLTFYINKSS
jgi:hypothetical protein